MTNTKSLNETEKKVFEAIEKNDVILLKALLPNLENPDIMDENSMTPLQHAAYKGNKDIVQLLLDHGSDVNLCAKSQVTNSVGRTPCQMAAFVGNTQCADAINHFVPKEEVDYYLTHEPKLPTILADKFHLFIMQSSVHPVRVIFNLQKYIGLSEHLEEVKAVLQDMRDKEMKKGAEMNEVMAFKFHYLSCLVGEIIALKKKQEEGDGKKKTMDTVDLFTRNMLKPNKEKELEFMDKLLKEYIKEFPYRESILFRQMLTSLTNEASFSTLNVIKMTLNGNMSFLNNNQGCATCGEPDKNFVKKCSKCKSVIYCDKNCQRLHWHWHKKECDLLQNDTNSNTKTVPDASELSAELQKVLIDPGSKVE
ncbi:ankyrin repeat and MYND domain-containing protein 2-like isoform X2 [Coccinella septempunctata]|uniref:ankyrin repeat and MYND domain-containing protein 2-like isoform X2 n=1 Tax=Coccinella septempunctata TaxID=41139 RepID=UPI001D07B32E|nr:ankyrin repeat and MYND domain-containing protein 2-like isoform X2 [Coccinella septempunctata]